MLGNLLLELGCLRTEYCKFICLCDLFWIVQPCHVMYFTYQSFSIHCSVCLFLKADPLSLVHHVVIPLTGVNIQDMLAEGSPSCISQ